MKRIDSYLIQSFIPPFVATFFIAVFVLILQILWVYIDDIIGKGSSMLFLLEMIFYLSMTLIPLALPIAVLISSVMVMGNLSERYELSSLKSAGVSLARIIRPLIYLSIAVAAFSFVCSNYLIPIANLKGKTRLYDVRKQKPNLNLEAGRFNEDFDGYVMYAGSKSSDGRHIYDVMIYTADFARTFQVVTAEKGQLYLTPDQQYMVLELENGQQYQEMEPGSTTGTYPFLRSEFKQWQKLFDLGQFDIERTDESSFRTNATVLSIPRIKEAMDSVVMLQEERISQFQRQVIPYLRSDTIQVTQEKQDVSTIIDSLVDDDDPVKRDSLEARFKVLTEEKIRQRQEWHERQTYQETTVTFQADTLLDGKKSLIETYPVADRDMLMGRARVMARTVQGEASSTNRVHIELDKNLAKYQLEIHLKYSVAFICIIFLFIGAPMGAIVRKGGFGYPLLVAICFFMLFMILNMLFKSLAEKLIISPFLGAWMPNFILAPLSLFLTYRAMIDARLFDMERIFGPIVRLVVTLKQRYGKKVENVRD